MMATGQVSSDPGAFQQEQQILTVDSPFGPLQVHLNCGGNSSSSSDSTTSTPSVTGDHQTFVYDMVNSTGPAAPIQLKVLDEPSVKKIVFKPAVLIPRKKERKIITEDKKDFKYLEDRRKNTLATRRSRETYRVKMERITQRKEFLEKAIPTLTEKIQKLRDEERSSLDINMI